MKKYKSSAPKGYSLFLTACEVVRQSAEDIIDRAITFAHPRWHERQREKLKKYTLKLLTNLRVPKWLQEFAGIICQTRQLPKVVQAI